MVMLMNNEIKEIERILATSGKYITYAERCYVLDYITNLQQEKDTYKEQLRITHKDLEHYISRCEKVSEIIEKEKENMGYAKYDGCLLLIENALKNGSENDDKN